MSKWQDISTAPRDGTDVLVVGANGIMRVAIWDTTVGAFRANIHSYVKLTATHWMPLPEPPKESKE